MRLRQPSTAQQKLKRSWHTLGLTHSGSRASLRSYDAECSVAPPQSQHRAARAGGRKVAVEGEQLLMERGGRVSIRQYTGSVL